MLGGVVRIPKVQQLIRDELGIAPGTRINGDEGMSLGATLVSLNSTTGLKVERVFHNDGPDYSIKVTLRPLNASEPEKTSVIFEGGKTRYATKKTVDVKALSGDFELTLSETPGDFQVRYLVSGVRDAIRKHAAKNITEFKGQLTLELDALGIPRLDKMEMIFKENRTEFDIRKVNRTNETSGQPAVFEEKVPKYVQHILRDNIFFSKSFENAETVDLNPVFLAESRSLLDALNKREQRKKLISQKRNRVEALIYNLRDLAEDKHSVAYLTQQDIQDFLAKADELSLFTESEEFANASAADLDRIQRQSDSVTNLYNYRKREHEERNSFGPQAGLKFKGLISELEKIKKEKPWIPNEKSDDLMRKTTQAMDWALQKLDEQSSLPLNQNPVI